MSGGGAEAIRAAAFGPSVPTRWLAGSPVDPEVAGRVAERTLAAVGAYRAAFFRALLPIPEAASRREVEEASERADDLAGIAAIVDAILAVRGVA